LNFNGGKYLQTKRHVNCVEELWVDLKFAESEGSFAGEQSVEAGRLLTDEEV
jgi:hypothetical protein